MATWFRSWHGAPTDPKWLVIARKAGVSPAIVTAVFWAVCDYASQERDRGSIVGFETETYAEFAGIPESDIRAILDALTDKGLIVDGRLAAWERRQPQREDDSTPRVRAFREREREVKRDVTHGNNTEQNRADTEQSRTDQTRADSFAPARERARNATWDALAAEAGEPATQSEKSDFAKTVRELDEIKATPGEITAFPPWWYGQYPEATLTHRCYRSHFGKFRTAPPKPPPRIRNPMLQAVVTNPDSLSDIEAEFREHGSRRGLRPQATRSVELPALATGNGTGSRSPTQDVLPPSRRAGT